MEKYGPAIEPHWEDQYKFYDFRPFGGEYRDIILARHLEVLKSLAKENPSDIILLVGHGRGMSTLLAKLGYPPDLNQGEYQIIEYNPD